MGRGNLAIANLARLSSPKHMLIYQHTTLQPLTYPHKKKNTRLLISVALKNCNVFNEIVFALVQKLITITMFLGTPTNPTPPDSLTSEDSSYVSAKESSSNSVSRVRFSPITATMTESNILDLPPHGDSTVPLQASRRHGRHSRESSRTRRPSITELEREFLS